MTDIIVYSRKMLVTMFKKYFFCSSKVDHSNKSKDKLDAFIVISSILFSFKFLTISLTIFKLARSGFIAGT